MSGKDVLVRAINEPRGVVRLFGRQHVHEVSGYDVFYVRAEHVGRFPKEWEKFIGESAGGYARVQWPNSSFRSRVKRLAYYQESLFAPNEIEVLEGDVDPAQRFLIERPSVQFADDWRLLYFDLETEKIRDWDRPWESRILSYAWRSSTGASGFERLESANDMAELALLSRLIDTIEDHDIALAWNGSRFDFSVVRGRAERLGARFDIECVHWLDHLKLFKRYFTRTSDGAVKQSFSLDSVAAAFLGSERKLPVEEIARERGFQGGDLFTWLWSTQPELLEEYNRQDVQLMQLLEDKTAFIKLHLSICRLCRVLPTHRSLFPMTLVDGRMFQRGHSAGYHFPSRFEIPDEEAEKFQVARGAYVPEAKIGLHDSVAVVDYARMYPSIILTFNMSPETLDENGDLKVPETSPRGALQSGYVARFRSNIEGHLPAALRGVIEERKKYSKLKESASIGSDEWHEADRLSTACKVLANTFYGIILSPYSRYYRREIGESVTSFGRHLLSCTIAEVERRGHAFIFGDTDSVAFVANDSEATAVCDSMNTEIIPELLQRFGASGGVIRLEYEKRFSRVLVTASKRYAGRFAVYGGKPVEASSKFDVRGLEVVRSDVCVAARLIQRSVIECILDGEPAQFIWDRLCELREDFIGGKTPVADLVLRKSVTKSVDKYVNKPPQVRVAERMIKLGYEVGEGSKVAFLVARGGRPIMPSELADGVLDLGYYWNNQVYPPSRRVCESAFPEYKWSDISLFSGTDLAQIDLFERASPRIRLADRALDGTRGTSNSDQSDLFNRSHRISNGRPVRRISKSVACPVQPGERVIRGSKSGVVVLEIRESGLDAVRLREIVEEYPGDCELKLEMFVEDPRAIVHLDTVKTCASPRLVTAFGLALRSHGISWRIS